MTIEYNERVERHRAKYWNRKHYSCKECSSHGAVSDEMLVASCPTCGRRHLKFFASEAEYVRKEVSE